MRPGIRRSRTGCLTCRSRKIKCDERRPACRQCQKAARACRWPSHHNHLPRPRRANDTACVACREKKVKCVGDLHDACTRCEQLGLACLRPKVEQGHPVQESEQPPPPRIVDSGLALLAANAPAPFAPLLPPAVSESFPVPAQALAQTASLGALPAGTELDDLIQLYFSSVHHFGYYAFLHQPHVNRLLALGKAPRNLLLIMIASAMRFAAPATPQNLARADAWADKAIQATVPRIFEGFGAVQLMVLLLAQHYDLNRGHFTSAWLLGANCTRMMQLMSLHTFDRTYRHELTSTSPLLTSEALRRVAWSVFYADTITDGGRYGFHTVDDKYYRLQLPCGPHDFWAEEHVVTEPLFPQKNTAAGTGDMAAFLIRTAAVRRRALHFAFCASHSEDPVSTLEEELAVVEAEVKKTTQPLPLHLALTEANMLLYRDRLMTFLLLHILRHNLHIVLGRAALLVYRQSSEDKTAPIAAVRRSRISHALKIASLVADGLRFGVCFDPQVGVQAYVALEILLFEPRRLGDNGADAITLGALPNLLRVIRYLADRSDFVKQLHSEAVHRLLRCDCLSLLEKKDFDAFYSEYRLVGQEPAEYDFRDFRWAKLERLKRLNAGDTAGSERMVHDEALLEYNGDNADNNSSTDTAAAPFQGPMEATSVPTIVHSVPPAPDNAVQVSAVPPNSLSLGTAPVNVDAFALDWAWLMDEAGGTASVYQTGDPTLFWNQLEQI
ncbi:hypothetical protein SEUCBS139899_002179 [Sporothrix eucalyptigena]|uniref:Zn(2)-C6 fungal-type domain-containing protein n=1 Tax=Sporothrix eucalyptigena TaxID=1812306 RepID=A0ABP0B4Q5_9PEZI